MFDFSRQNVSDADNDACLTFPAYGFHWVTADTKDFGRVVLGGGFAGVAANNNDKVRG